MSEKEIIAELEFWANAHPQSVQARQVKRLTHYVSLLEAKHQEQTAALESAKKFIQNGIKFDCIDPIKPGSLESFTLPAIIAALTPIGS